MLTLVCNGILIVPPTDTTPARVIENGAVLYDKDGIILDVGDTDEIRYKIFRETPIEEEIHLKIIDAKKRVIMPGLICAHHHLYSTFARGLLLKEQPRNFVEILEKLWWKLDKNLTSEDVYYSAVVGLIDCLKKGVTTVIDHHESQGTQMNVLDEIKKATDLIKLRVNMCIGVSDRYNKSEEGLNECERFLEEISTKKPKRISAMAGLHAAFTVSDKTLTKTKEISSKYNVGVHIHCAEDEFDQKYSLENYGMRVVERLKNFDLLDEKTILAHCVHINEDEMKIIREKNANVVVNPESNMNNAVGCANILKMIQYGINLGIGTDGMSPDMLVQARVLFLVQRHVNSNPTVAFKESVNALLIGNAKLAERLFGTKISSLQKGSPADIIIFDYIPPTELNENNYMGHIMFGLVNSEVNTVIVDGEILMQDKRIIGINENIICAEARRLSEKLWERLNG